MQNILSIYIFEVVQVSWIIENIFNNIVYFYCMPLVV
uniref:Uncharacterized protein n=1 Tax=Anguilla anguilla TaxID=7936 RepID=A0A0E9PB71_ANGAN